MTNEPKQNTNSTEWMEELTRNLIEVEQLIESARTSDASNLQKLMTLRMKLQVQLDQERIESCSETPMKLH
jgi:hypothetical protein